MPIQQFQTAAVRIFRLHNPSNRDLERLSDEFPLHPHDREEFCVTATKPGASQYAGTSLLRLPWADFDQANNDMVPSEISVIVHDDALAILTRGDESIVNNVIDGVLQDAGGKTFPTTTDVVAELLWQLSQRAQQTLKNFSTALAPSLIDSDGRTLTSLFQQTAASIATFQTNLMKPPANAMIRLKLIAHQFSHFANTLAQHPRPVMRTLPSAPAVLPKVATTYMVASAAIILVVLFVVAI